MKSENKKKLIVTLFGILAFAYLFFGAPAGGNVERASADELSGTPTPTATPTPVPELIAISAQYNGTSKLIGESIDKADIEVMAFYSDGSSIRVADGEYALSQSIVTLEGSNNIIVIYRTKTVTMQVTGKKISSLSVICSRYMLSIGNAVDKKDLTVTVSYTDGSFEEVSDYRIINGTITGQGEQKVSVFYKNVVAETTVYGNAPGTIVSIAATLDRDNVVAGVELDPLDFTVMAVYKDGSTERVTNFVISRTLFDAAGKYDVSIVYGGFRTTVSVTCIERKAVSMRAVYDNTQVMTGDEIRDENLKVYVTFIDGVEEQVNDYVIYSKVVKYLGENTIRIYYGDLQTEITVTGTAYIAPSFDYVSSYTVTNGTDTATIAAAIPVSMSEDALGGESLSSGNLKKIFRRLRVDGDYIGFTIEFKDMDDEAELPMAVRITLPSGYDMEDTYLYYTPNLRTIVGRMNKTEISDRVFETMVFKTGTYMLVCSPDFNEEEEE